MQTGIAFIDRFIHHVQLVFISPFDPSQRIFWFYLLSSAVIAYGVYIVAKSRGEQTEKSFLRFLFPQKVWQNPSAWLDLRYFFFHRIFGHFIVMLMGGGTTVLVYKWLTGVENPVAVAMDNVLPPASEVGISIAFMVIALIVIDFIAFFTHYIQHKSTFLWQFHKVHHSAEVMHPVSNFREHPIDNLVYVIFTGVGYGAVMGGATLAVGFTPSMPSLLGVPVFHLLFNVAGYNLRHSHIWLKWPGVWSKIFPSPAHHHVHHSCHPDHIDKNFAFFFPMWDVLFKTYHMPADNRDVKFGIGKEDTGEFTSCARLYWVPVRDAYRLLRRRAKKRFGAKPEKTQVPSIPAE
ncbi:MAG: sterol desaturase family protein [Pseudomonadota bacterium]